MHGVQESFMRAAPQPALTSTYHPCNQVAGILRAHVAAALALLHSDRPGASGIHTARQELKRARAALRLLRESIDREEFRQEDATLQQAAQQLNDVRDCEVVLRVFLRLRAALQDEPRRPRLEPLHKLLLQQRRSASALREPLEAAGTLLTQARERARDWSVENDLDLLARAMQRTYSKGRGGYRAVCEAATDEHLHAWRRQVKYSAYQLEALGSLAPDRVKKRLRRSAKLARLLGRDRDLSLLHQAIPDAHLDAASRLRLERAITSRRTELQRRALQLGRRLYRTKARKFRPLTLN